MKWALVAVAVVGAIIALTTLLGVRSRRATQRIVDPGRGTRPDRFDRLHRQVAHYRASGALPRWDT